MKTLVCFLLLFFLLHFQLQSQNTSLLWAKSMGGYGTDKASAVTTDTQYNVISSGIFTYTVDLDPSVATYDVISVGLQDIFIQKLDSSGNFLWAKTLGSSGWDMVGSVKTDAQGNVYLAGMYRGTTDFDPGPATYTVATRGDWDVFLLKLDPAGNFLWVKTFGGTDQDWVRDMVMDADSNLYMIGTYTGNVDLDPGPQVFISAGGGYVSKFDAAGNFLWAKTMGVDGNSVYLDAKKNIYVAGSLSGSADMDPGTGVYMLTSAGQTDIYIQKLDSLGNFIWAERFGGSSSWGEWAQGINIDQSGNVLICGVFSGTVDFDAGPGVATLTGLSSGYDSFVAKYNSAGNYMWAKRMGGPGQNNWAKGICSDTNGFVYVTGRADGSGDFDPGPAIYTLNNVGSLDIYVQKFDSLGNFVWVGNIGSTGPDEGFAIHRDRQGRIYCVGDYFLTADFDIDLPVSTLSAYYNTEPDAFVFKMQPALCSDFTLVVDSIVPLKCNAPGYVGAHSLYGLAPYTYSWTGTQPGNTSGAASFSMAGSFKISVADARGCSRTETIVIAPHPTLTVVATQTNITCSVPGNARVLVNGGEAPYTYSWSPSVGSTSLLTTLSAGIYSCQITDLNGCAKTQTFSISSNTAQPLVTVSGSGQICSGETASLSASGASTYSWSTGSTNASITVNPGATATYTVFGTNAANGCIGTGLKTLTVNLKPVVYAQDTAACMNTSLIFAPSGASSYTLFSPSSAPQWGMSFTLSPHVTTTYSVRGISADGCISANIAAFTLTVEPTPTLAANSGSVCASQPFTIVPSGAHTYSISGNNFVVSPTSTAVYTITGTSFAGCLSAAITTTVQVYQTPAISVAGGSICAGGTFVILPSGAYNYTISGGSATVSPASTTAYSVTGTSQEGCLSSNIAVAEVTVIALPTVSVNSGTVCAGHPFIIVPAGTGSGYNITGGNFTVNPSVNSSYSVTATGISGCMSASPAVATVSVRNLPDVKVSITDSILCKGNSTILTASGALNYLWVNGPATNTFFVAPVITTTYSGVGIDSVGCARAFTIVQIVDECTGMHRMKTEPAVSAIFPNPHKEFFMIELANREKTVMLTLYNAMGQVVWRDNVVEGIQKINTGDLPPGVYQMVVSKDKNILQVSRIIKQQ